MVRRAVKNDIARIVDMGARFIRETGYSGQLPENRSKMADLVNRLIEDPNGLVLVATDPSGLIGMLGAIAFKHPMSDELVASEMFWWIEPETRGSGVKLLRTAENWASQLGARRFIMIAPTERVGQFYERVGYERVETSYQRKL